MASCSSPEPHKFKCRSIDGNNTVFVKSKYPVSVGDTIVVISDHEISGYYQHSNVIPVSSSILVIVKSQISHRD